ncbi:hypothetical protein [Scytonema sp. NUACC21]
MQKQKSGRIIAISSIGGRQGVAGVANRDKVGRHRFGQIRGAGTGER